MEAFESAKMSALRASQALAERARRALECAENAWREEKPRTPLGWTVSRAELSGCSQVPALLQAASAHRRCRLISAAPHSAPTAATRRQPCPRAQTFVGLALLSLAVASSVLVALSGTLIALCWAGVAAYTFLVSMATLGVLFVGGATLLFSGTCAMCGCAVLMGEGAQQQ
jgi:hypothetical protein